MPTNIQQTANKTKTTTTTKKNDAILTQHEHSYVPYYYNKI